MGVLYGWRAECAPASFVRTLLVLLGLAVAGKPLRVDDDTIKIGFIDPSSGAFAAGGDASLKQTQFILDYVNAKGSALGKKFEVITFDDKLQPVEALIALTHQSAGKATNLLT